MAEPNEAEAALPGPGAPTPLSALQVRTATKSLEVLYLMNI